MANNEWQYTDNQFLNATKGNYRLAVQLSNYHDAQLNELKATIPALLPIYTRNHPLNTTLTEEYNNWKSAGGGQVGKTEMLKQGLVLIYDLMDKWDRDIQVEFLPKTPQYKGIFPAGRKPFNVGKLDDRINAYDTLAKNLIPYPALAATMAEIESSYAGLDQLRDMQEGAKGSVKAGSSKVEAARIAAMTMQWRNTGFAMDAFSTDLPFIESLFDLESLRDKVQTKFTGTLAPAEIKEVFKRTLIASDKLRLKNTGLANYKIYLATTSNGINSAAIEVLAGEEKLIDVTLFGVADYHTHRYLTIINQSDTAPTHFLIEIK